MGLGSPFQGLNHLPFSTRGFRPWLNTVAPSEPLLASLHTDMRSSIVIFQTRLKPVLQHLLLSRQAQLLDQFLHLILQKVCQVGYW